MPKIEVQEHYLLLEDLAARVMVDVHWPFSNPTEAGQAVGYLVRSLVRSFEEPNSQHNRREITNAFMLGLTSVVSRHFVAGDDSDILPRGEG